MGSYERGSGGEGPIFFGGDDFGLVHHTSESSYLSDDSIPNGFTIDTSAIAGFGEEVHSDLFLHPDPATIAVPSWLPEDGRVVRMFCSITDLEGNLFAHDTRSILKHAITDITLFLTPTEESYLRQGENKVPKYIFWSSDS